tara:strand:+ start:2106 stop:4046 length:1941 start_codon:yes stop_codon:yes gene_type:complete
VLKYPSLFSELKVGKKKLKNRICLCATVTNFAQNNRITEPWRNFLLERARGGAAMLVTEVIAVDPEAIAQSSTITGFNQTNEAGFRQIADDVHEEDSLIVGQLWHPGRQQLWHPTKSPIGVSDIPDPYSGTVPHVMKTEEVLRVAESYVNTAKRLSDCGFDGVELHGAHGYLIMQFLSPASNNREDMFGGGLEARTLFVRKIAEGIREKCRQDFIIGLKMPADEGVPGGVCPDEAARITKRLSKTGCFDYFAYGQGNFSLSLENHVPDMYFDQGAFIELHKKMRSVSGNVPVMALGRIGEPNLANRIIEEGFGDLVGMSRALITDPAWPEKARLGNQQDIRPCVYDNFSWGEVHLGKPLAEHHNAFIGQANEAFRLPQPADFSKRVMVVGGGVSGLEAAWVCAAKGHGVTLFSSASELGGGLLLESKLPGREEMRRIIEHQIFSGEKYGVEYVLNYKVSARDIVDFGSDVVLLAAGANHRVPGDLERGAQVLSAREYTIQSGNLNGKTAVLIDEDGTAATYGVADLMAQNFKSVILVTSRPRVAASVNHCSAIGVFRRLYGANIQIQPAQQVLSFVDKVVTLKNPYNAVESKISDIDLLVYSTPRISNDQLADELDDPLIEKIGDCRSPRNLMTAIQNGHAIADAL